MSKWWLGYISSQYRKPRGIVGWWIGRQMLEQHQPENLWTIDLLDIQPTDSVLEIGFGPGLAIREAVQRAFQGHVSGIDFSRAMVRMARRRNGSAIHDGIVDLRVGDAHALPYSDSSFDKVYSIHSIYFWKQPLRVLKEIRRVLRLDGLLALTILPHERFNAPEGEPLDTPTFKAYTGEAIQSMLFEVGFTNTWIENDPAGICASNYTILGQKV